MNDGKPFLAVTSFLVTVSLECKDTSEELLFRPLTVEASGHTVINMLHESEGVDIPRSIMETISAAAQAISADTLGKGNKIEPMSNNTKERKSLN